MKATRIVFLLLLYIGAASACSPRKKQVVEVPVKVLPMAGPCADASLELSAMQWYGDVLILVPERLGLKMAGEDNHLVAGQQYVYALQKQDIIDTLDGRQRGPLVPHPIPVTPSIVGKLPGIDGFEAVAFAGETVFLQVETYTNADGTNPSMVIRGTIAPDLSELILDIDSIRKYPRQTRDPNISHEAIFVHNDDVYSIYELNSAMLVPKPTMNRFGLDLSPRGEAPFPHLDYRVTDVTALDERGRLWALNYRFPGAARESLDPATEPLATRYGRGRTHQRYDQVERIVSLVFERGAVKLANEPPLQMELSGDWRQGGARNWEGIVRLDKRGFLIITDEHPQPITTFGFVPAAL